MAQWCKLHTDILADPKLMRAARLGTRGILLLPWFLAFAKAADDEGRLTVAGVPADPIDIADCLPGVTEEDVSVALATLTDMKVLVREDDGALRFRTWDERQANPFAMLEAPPEKGKKPSDAKASAAERQRRHREKKKAGHAGVTPPVTRNVTPPVTPHVTRGVTPPVTPDVTPLEENRTDQNRAEQEPRVTRVTPQVTPHVTPRDAAAAALLSRLDSLRIDLTVAANQAITAKWGEQVTPLFAGSGAAQQLAEAVQGAGIPAEFACETIREVIARVSQKPSAMSYFRLAILEAWDKARDRAIHATKRDGVTPQAAGIGRATELWRILRATALQKAPIEQRESLIAQYVARGSIPDERAFRHDWGIVHLAAPMLIGHSREDGQIVRALWAALLTGKQEPYPEHLKHLPHPWLDWPGRDDTHTSQPGAA